MHIPDGYIGPLTWIPLWIIMIPLWAIASRKLKKDLNLKQIPFLAIGASFSFLIMMFNIPIAGGSTGHAVGGTIIAIILGPWAALIAISVALIIQALFFGDGGITAIGANCFNMSFILPFIGYAIYKLIAGKTDIKDRRRWIGAFFGSYIAIIGAALCTALELGLQTILYPSVDGNYAYFMYPLNIVVPIMLLEHLILFGIIEAVVTALIVIYLQKSDPTLLQLYPPKAEVEIK